MTKFQYGKGTVPHVQLQVYMDQLKIYTLKIADLGTHRSRLTHDFMIDLLCDDRKLDFCIVSACDLYRAMTDGLKFVVDDSDFIVPATKITEIARLMWEGEMLPYHDKLLGSGEGNVCRVVSSHMKQGAERTNATFLSLMRSGGMLMIHVEDEKGVMVHRCSFVSMLKTYASNSTRHGTVIVVPQISGDGNVWLFAKDVKRLVDKANTETELVPMSFDQCIKELT